MQVYFSLSLSLSLGRCKISIILEWRRLIAHSVARENEYFVGRIEMISKLRAFASLMQVRIWNDVFQN